MEDIQEDLPFSKDIDHIWESPIHKIVIAKDREEGREELGVFHERQAPPIPRVGERLDFDRGVEDSESELEWNKVGKFVVEDVEYGFGFATYFEGDEDEPTDRLFVNVHILVTEK